MGLYGQVDWFLGKQELQIVLTLGNTPIVSQSRHS